MRESHRASSTVMPPGLSVLQTCVPRPSATMNLESQDHSMCSIASMRRRGATFSALRVEHSGQCKTTLRDRECGDARTLCREDGRQCLHGGVHPWVVFTLKSSVGIPTLGIPREAALVLYVYPARCV